MYDVIVVGIGGMGSATLFQCAQLGLRTLGLEQFDIPHSLGSSHGQTRIIRKPYFESLEYVPLLERAYILWDALQSRTAEELFLRNGSIDAGWEDCQTVQGSLKACREYSLRHELLDARSLGLKYPGYSLEPGMVAVYQEEGGLLVPELCVEKYVAWSVELGAEVHKHERVTHWEADLSHVKVWTTQGTYTARFLAITAGPWARDLLPELFTLAVPERQVVIWTEVSEPDLFVPARFPVFNLQASHDYSERYYGFPIYGDPRGFKIGMYHYPGQKGAPQEISREPTEAEDEPIRRAISRFFPKADGRTLARQECFFTCTPDEHFILDLHPNHESVAIAAGFSGHGFKFCSVVGEILTDLLTKGESQLDLGLFRLDREYIPPTAE